MLSELLSKLHPWVSFLSAIPLENLAKSRAYKPGGNPSPAGEGPPAQNLPHSGRFLEGGGGVAVADKPTPPGPPRPPAPPRAPAPKPKSGLTNEEILTYQNQEIGSELWQLERHLAQKCRIFSKPCDCCQKGTFIEGLARETIPIASRVGASTEPYEQLVAWLKQHGAKFDIDAVASGQHDKEYGQLAGELSLLRKRIMANKPQGAPLLEALSLEEAKKMAAEEAAKEVEQRWTSSALGAEKK